MVRKTMLTLLLAGMAATPVLASQPREASVADYRAQLADADANPGEFWISRGEKLFKEKRGPKKASLEKCDFGLGPGKLNGAYAKLPRYFRDTNQVMDLEARLVHCMVKLQGLERKDIIANAFAPNQEEGEMEALVTYIASRSNGKPFDVKVRHPKEKEMLAVGEKLFWRRAGLMDFSCATCHSEDNKRIRLQSLLYAFDEKQAQEVMTSWPTYRVSHGTVRTFQHRMWDCHWQMRLPDIGYGSEASVALTLFLTDKAREGTINVPGLKR